MINEGWSEQEELRQVQLLMLLVKRMHVHAYTNTHTAVCEREPLKTGSADHLL